MTRLLSLVTKPLLIAVLFVATVALGLTISAKALSSAMCRGANCIAWAGGTQDGVYENRLADRCFYLGSPTGIGIFNQRRFGGAARSLLASEYMLFGNEFLFIEPRHASEPVIVIDANRYRIDFPEMSFCNRGATTVRLNPEAKRFEVEGCASGYVKLDRLEFECRVDDGDDVPERSSGGGRRR